MKPRRHISFTLKVMVPMLAILTLLVVLMVSMSLDFVRTQYERNAILSLRQSCDVQSQFIDFWSREMQLRAGTVANDPRFKSVAQINDANTMEIMLQDLAEELEVSFIHYYTASGDRLAGVHHSATRESGAITLPEDMARRARSGVSSARVMELSGHIFDVAAIPVKIRDRVQGALVVGVEQTVGIAEKMRQLTGCEVILLMENVPLVSSLQPLPSSLQHPSQLSTGAEPGELQPIHIQGHAYLSSQALTAGEMSNGLSFILLYSYQEQLERLDEIQQTLMMSGVGGSLFSVLLVWLILIRLTRPLKELHLAVEALAGEDFSYRVPIVSQDEFGRLALAFNNMAARLEKTIGTLKETRVRLVQTEKLSAIGEFIAGIAHELNNPLTVMIGYAQLLEESELDPKHVKDILQIRESAVRCQKIVQNLLSFSRQQPPEMAPIYLPDLLKGTVKFLSYELRTSGIQVEELYASDLPSVLGDAHQLQQVFLNIINNARQAIEDTSADGHIQIEVHSASGRIITKITDNGPGIQPEHQERLFDPFFTTKEMGKGTGLGLSVSYGIVREHGGEILVQSEPGNGTTFLIDLPVHADEDIKQRVRSDPQPSPAPIAEFTDSLALVVDDEQDVREVTARSLERFGITVHTASGGREALQRLRTQPYDMVFSDLKMPDMNGRELFAEMQSEFPSLTSRFVLMTGDVLNPDAQSFIQESGVFSLSKPFSLEDLETLAAAIMEKA